MERRKKLTNEVLTKKFQNQFDLVNHAISVAAHLIQSGRDTYVTSGTENPALQSLEEIESGRDIYEEVAVEEVEEEIEEEEDLAPKKRKRAEKALSE